MLFFGSKDYLPLFDRLTSGGRHRASSSLTRRTRRRLAAARTVRFATNTQTIWHYECVYAFVAGEFDREIGAQA